MTREDAIALLNNLRAFSDNDDEPAIDMAIEALSAEAVQGEWEGYKADNPDWLRKDGTPIFLVCDKCHGMVLNNGSANWNFCPNCGCSMKKGD